MENIKILDELLKYLEITNFRAFAEMRNDANEKSEFLKDIDNFCYYEDKKYRANIKGELKEISERDFATLQYVVFGER